MKVSELANEAADKLPESAVDYIPVDVSENDFSPDRPFRAVYVGGQGDLDLVSPASGRSVVFTGVQPGLYPLGGRSIKAAGTTATNLIALF